MVIVVQRRDIWNWGGMDPERRIQFQSEVWKTPASESSWVLIKNWTSFHTLHSVCTGLYHGLNNFTIHPRALQKIEN